MIKTVSRHLYIVWTMFVMSLKTILEYRLNFILHLIYGPMYSLTLYLILRIAYARTPTLAGWNIDEGILLFFVFHFLYMTYYFFFMKGIRYLLWDGIRLGEIDFVLTKPVNPQFFISVSKPYTEQLLQWAGMGVLLLLHLHHMQLSVPVLDLLGFFVSFIGGIAIAYFVVTGYATAGFYMTKAEQIIEFFDKAADSSQYPIPIFPQSIQLLAFTLVPIAFFSYVPTQFLLGRGSLNSLIGMCILLVISMIINQVLWRRALREYSSASS